jgi:hypothetical protein
MRNFCTHCYLIKVRYFNLDMAISLRAIWKVTSNELLTKQAMKKKMLSIKKYVHT